MYRICLSVQVMNLFAFHLNFAANRFTHCLSPIRTVPIVPNACTWRPTWLTTWSGLLFDYYFPVIPPLQNIAISEMTPNELASCFLAKANFAESDRIPSLTRPATPNAPTPSERTPWMAPRQLHYQWLIPLTLTGPRGCGRRDGVPRVAMQQRECGHSGAELPRGGFAGRQNPHH